jgi:hypothetical protein
MVHIPFEKSNGKYSFTDALNLPDDHTFTEEEIEAMKQARFDRWLAIITTPATESDVSETME